MNCPRCATPMSMRRHEELEFDACASCGGLFLDRGELNRLAGPTEGDLEFSTLHGETYRHDDEFGPIACPRCAAPAMDKVEFNVHTGIVLDHCDACGGFWLDGRELERIRGEVAELNEPVRRGGSPAIEWFAQFLFSLPR